MEIILANLNDMQVEAVTSTSSNTLVIAAPGAGKTLVLSRRIAYLIKNNVDPSNILAVTFTNKAAREMKSRIHKLIGDSIEQCWIGTFHGICLRILSHYGRLVGLSSGFTIIDDKDQLKLIKKAIEDVGIVFNDKPDFILNKIGTYKNKLISVEQAYEENQAIAHVFHRYQELLKENNCLDFDEIQVKTVELLQNHTHVRQALQSRFTHIAIDELQDTCNTQYRIIQLLTNEATNLFSVCDIDQSIFGFRAANIQNVYNIQALQDSELIKMEQNYRSTKVIVNAANAVINNNTREIEKVIWTDNKNGLNLVHYCAEDETDEANFVASVIKQTLVKEPARKFTDFTILYRTNAQSRAIEEALLVNGIPYQLVGNVSFFQRKEIKDTVAYLKIITNKYDSLALSRVINVPKRGIGDTTLTKLEQYANKHGLIFPQALTRIDDVAREMKISTRTVNAIKGFLTSIADFRLYAEEHSIVELLSYIWKNTQYIEVLYADGTEDSRARVDNLKEFYTLAKNHEESVPNMSVDTFLNSISLYTDQDSIRDSDVVKLMTSHTSKGLEFPIIFMVGLEDGTFPHFRSISNPEELEEERRLFYVALTRAEEKIYLSHSKYKAVMGLPVMQSVSRFVDEIPSNLIVNVR